MHLRVHQKPPGCPHFFSIISISFGFAQSICIDVLERKATANMSPLLYLHVPTLPLFITPKCNLKLLIPKPRSTSGLQ